ncbi:DUF1613-domain-containing protein [Lindgomyces ingoldianus]|uniref:DUF1613-domain-containing protein n=1 Tax=Lindgomyces ingoldianus TaxID=673940 RepID=A0ACB6QGE2_9PLEO|nr:DUF1613-domain-containing protein [Lindgomyces ingoldianus]KAF2465962.1 DUF1613-domain-containing protein [Lindgomyces ingoldianus]
MTEAAPTVSSVGCKFEPVDLENCPTIDSGLPHELWTIVQSAQATFSPEFFLEVSRNLLENPNLTASHLARAELSYQSFMDASFNPKAEHPHELAKIVKHLKVDHQPILIPEGYPGYLLEWTVVRKLIPRNPKLDKPLMQTCHLFTSTDDVIVKNGDRKEEIIKAERYLVVYLPHVSDPEEIPFYHPKVRALAVLYTFQPDAAPGTPSGTLSLYYDLFPEKELDNRLSRTALKMLQIIHKHSNGRMAGYQKRVHHDIVIPQKQFQDTYAYLKGKYASSLIKDWVEQTPAEKHVFEDLGIAAFLIELWTDMYGRGKANAPPKAHGGEKLEEAEADNESVTPVEAGLSNHRRVTAKTNFPGFVDIGCGNGLLVWILSQEGWDGWGFDVRARKTWDTFPESVRDKLKEMLLVPEVLKLLPTTTSTLNQEDQVLGSSSTGNIHNGIFPKGTFIIANHADELTIWTPFLASLSQSPFIAIPCCSHNFDGTRFRAPHYHQSSEGKPQDKNYPSHKPSRQPSAYASFCSYITYLTTIIDYTPEKEYLRIPSTRNVAILGRKASSKIDTEERLAILRTMVEEETGLPIGLVREGWLKRGSGLTKPGKGSGH